MTRKLESEERMVLDSFMIVPTIRDRVTDLSKRLRRSKSNLYREAITLLLEKYKDPQDVVKGSSEEGNGSGELSGICAPCGPETLPEVTS